jgi:predicted histidine transporter YuiF (NhaC family)
LTVDGDTIALNITSHNSRIQQQMKENNNRFSVKKMFTGKAVLPILFLIVGVIVATFQIRGKSQSLVRNKRTERSLYGIVEANSLLRNLGEIAACCVFLIAN